MVQPLLLVQSHSGHHNRAGISSCRLRRASPIRSADASRCPGSVIHTIADCYPDTLAYPNANCLPISYSNYVAHTNSQAFAYPFSDGHSYPHTYPHCHAFTLAYRRPDSYTDGHSDAITDPHPLTQPDACANLHTSAYVHPHLYAPTDGKPETV